MNEIDTNQIIITVTGKDKVGIVSAVSNALANHKVNIEDIKQTIMQDNFVKTSTGFVKNGVGATVEDVKLMFETVKNSGLSVKASGGIKNYEQAKALIEAGATRLGTSSGVDIFLGEVK